ncbi:PTS cellobiose transporter subunit IIA [Enterococcus pallens]|uniref:PTS system cellobiose-specific IIA componenent n=1 Tax=Enterococcus pallens ATCC BAA-351 TaxID=1158607 RepID=R2Q5J5_9ENTE|nr:PTS cellobiose transporter subunit IIA [Enterococcus pallens]EOH91817.1 PTS system cellobiose-specific IIA componenent [Enterococcus pallens ATCC BAA-351]EOU25245.1 PTS system cellobiose-specific IIA componenent [Enterococcus pallens ATCC BAA-351]OJG79955.1 PTS system cellobiose-specific IIA componenent [Enterococcus pallens]
MDSEKLQEIAFEIILSSGDARTLVHESFQHMRDGSFDAAQQKLDDANESLVKAHKAQTGLLQEYAGGEKIEMEIIMVHAQDHLMTTMTLKEVAAEMLVLYQRQAAIK